MPTDGNHPNPNDETNRCADDANCWQHARAIVRCIALSLRAFFCWLAGAFRIQESFPHFLVAAFTLLLAIFAAYAWQESKHGTDQLRAQANAAQDQLTILKNEQRPWVGLSALGPHSKTPHPLVGQDFFMFVNWSNSGHTPAFKVIATFKADVEQPPTIPLPRCEDCVDGDVMLPSIPIGRTPHIDGSKLTQDIADRIMSGSQKIWLVGRIDYVDGENAPHKTLICYNFTWDGSFISCAIPGSNNAD